MSNEISEVVAGQVNERFIEVPTNPTYFADLATLNAAQSGAQNPFDAVVREVVDLRAAAGNMSAFDSRYQPLASDTVWVGASQMSSASGTPSLATPSGLTYWPAWRLDADITEQIAGSFVVPQGWTTANVDLYWFNHGTGAGNVRISISYRVNMAAGSNLNSNVTDSAAQTVTAGSQNILVVTRMVTGWALPAAGRVTNVAPYRLGADAADTLANDMGILGVLITRAS